MDWSLASLETEGGWAYSCLKKEKKGVNGTWTCNQGDFVSPSGPSSPPLPRLLFPLNPFIVIIMCRNLCPHATPTIDRLEKPPQPAGFSRVTCKGTKTHPSLLKTRVSERLNHRCGGFRNSRWRSVADCNQLNSPRSEVKLKLFFFRVDSD